MKNSLPNLTRYPKMKYQQCFVTLRQYHRKLSISGNSFNVDYMPFVPQREKHGQDLLIHGIWTHTHGCPTNNGWRRSSNSYRRVSRSRLRQLIPAFYSQYFGMVWNPKKGNQSVIQSRNIRVIPHGSAKNRETSSIFLSRIGSIFEYIFKVPKITPISSAGAHLMWKRS